MSWNRRRNFFLTTFLSTFILFLCCSSTVFSSETATTSSTYGLTFSETMKGKISQPGAEVPLILNLDLSIADIDAWEKDPNHPIDLQGVVTLPEQGSFPVKGQLLFMVENEGPYRGYALRYQFKSEPSPTTQEVVSFDGKKVIIDHPGLDILEDMTVLNGVFTLQRRQDSEDSNVQQFSTTFIFPYRDPQVMSSFLSSMKVQGTNNPFIALKVKGKFLKAWLRGLFKEYTHPAGISRLLDFHVCDAHL